MQNILLIICLLLCATFCPAQTYTQEDLSDTVRKEIKEDIYSDKDYTNFGACPYCQHLRYDLGYFAKVMLVVDDRINSIVIDGSLVTIWGDYRKGFAREGGRENIYNQFHDIYILRYLTLRRFKPYRYSTVGTIAVILHTCP
ncbi:MAG: hypothetical protein LUD76_01075 [Alistipes sp.]|nr:hypothetical protein [Alistipes sp.]